MDANTARKNMLYFDIFEKDKDLGKYIIETNENIEKKSKEGQVLYYIHEFHKKNFLETQKIFFMKYYKDLGYNVDVFLKNDIVISWGKEKEEENITDTTRILGTIAFLAAVSFYGILIYECFNFSLRRF